MKRQITNVSSTPTTPGVKRQGTRRSIVGESGTPGLPANKPKSPNILTAQTTLKPRGSETVPQIKEKESIETGDIEATPLGKYVSNQIEQLSIPEAYESFQNNDISLQVPIAEELEIDEGDNISINIVNQPRPQIHEVIENRAESLFDIDMTGIEKLIPVKRGMAESNILISIYSYAFEFHQTIAILNMLCKDGKKFAWNDGLKEIKKYC